MIENKVLVTVNVPSLEKSFDVYIPVNRRIHGVIKMLKMALFELSLGSFDMNKNYALYNGESGIEYDVNLLVRETDIRNGSMVILL